MTRLRLSLSTEDLYSLWTGVILWVIFDNNSDISVFGCWFLQSVIISFYFIQLRTLTLQHLERKYEIRELVGKNFNSGYKKRYLIHNCLETNLLIMPRGKPLVKNWDKHRTIPVITPSRYEQNEASVKAHWKKVMRDLELSYKDDQVKQPFWKQRKF